MQVAVKTVVRSDELFCRRVIDEESDGTPAELRAPFRRRHIQIELPLTIPIRDASMRRVVPGLERPRRRRIRLYPAFTGHVLDPFPPAHRTIARKLQGLLELALAPHRSPPQPHKPAAHPPASVAPGRDRKSVV